MGVFSIIVLCLFSLQIGLPVDARSAVVKSTLHNWGRVNSQLVEFENWLCGNDEAIGTVTRFLPSSARELSEIDVNGLICTYNTYSPKITEVITDYFGEILGDSSLAIPGYTIWNLFNDFTQNRRDILATVNEAFSGRSDADILWVFRNEETLVDLKQAFLGAQKDLMGLQGYHF